MRKAWWIDYLPDIHVDVGFRRLIATYPCLLQKINRTRDSHRDVIFEAKEVLEEVITNETSILAVEIKSLINSLQCTISILYKMSVLHKLGKAFPHWKALHSR